MADRNGTATLGCNAGYTVFSGGGATIRFRAPYSLKRYIRVKEWDEGYWWSTPNTRTAPPP